MRDGGREASLILPIDFDMEVELLQPDVPPSLGIVRSRMTLRDALEAILEMPRDRWLRSGIGLSKPIRMMLHGREMSQCYLSSFAARALVGEHDVPSDGSRNWGSEIPD